MKRKIQFVANGVRCALEIEAPRGLQREGTPPELSICGEAAGHLGQCEITIREAIGSDAPDVSRVLEIWDEYHLKPVPAAVVEELEAVASRIDGQRYGGAPDVDEAPEIGGDVMDSRDVVRRTEIYRDAVAAMGIDPNEVDSHLNVEGVEDLNDVDLEILEEYAKLKALDEDGESAVGRSEWQSGSTLVLDSYFEEYAQQLAEDLGAVNADASWPNNRIDWSAAADDLQQDYTSVEYDGDTYWVR